MDLPKLLTTMKDSIFEVFDNMLFLPVGVSPAVDGIDAWMRRPIDLIGATMSFSGPADGTFLFLIPRDLGAEITVNFLGLDEASAGRGQIEDTAMEVLNMVGGRSLSLLDAPGDVTLGLPEAAASPGDTFAAFAGEHAGVLLFESDTHHLLFGVRMQ